MRFQCYPNDPNPKKGVVPFIIWFFLYYSVSFLVHDGITFQEIVEITCIISMGGYYEIHGKSLHS
jgi:hypothetical protein